jgi:hypothetical protein
MPDIIRDADLVAISPWLKAEGTADSSAPRKPMAAPAASDEAPDDLDRLPAGVAAAVIILLSIGLWAVIITAALWLVSVM